MRLARWLTLVLLALTIASAQPSFVSAAPAQKKKQEKEEGGKKQDPERLLTGLIRGMQMDLESGSSRGFLTNFDSAKFEDYPRFEDTIERLTREDNLRVYFRQTSNSIKDNNAQVIVDADMELTRKDSAGKLDRRRQQIVIDFEATSRGWKIVNITPREFFRPL